MWPRWRHSPSAQLLEPRAQPALGVVDDVVHPGQDRLGAEVPERLAQPGTDDLDRRHLRAQVEAQQLGQARVAQVGALDVVPEAAALDELDRPDQRLLAVDVGGIHLDLARRGPPTSIACSDAPAHATRSSPSNTGPTTCTQFWWHTDT